MNKEILNSDGSRNYQANILLDNVKRLEQENEQLKADIQSRTMCITCERELQNCNLQAENEQLKQTLQEIKEIAEKDFRHTAWEEYARQLKEIIAKINEVIGAE